MDRKEQEEEKFKSKKMNALSEKKKNTEKE